MKVIHKYPVPIDDQDHTYELPEGARVLMAGKDAEGTPCIWIEKTETVTRKQNRTFRLVGTGMQYSDIYENWQQVASFIDLPFVWHIIERIR